MGGFNVRVRREKTLNTIRGQAWACPVSALVCCPFPCIRFGCSINSHGCRMFYVIPLFEPCQRTSISWNSCCSAAEGRRDLGTKQSSECEQEAGMWVGVGHKGDGFDGNEVKGWFWLVLLHSSEFRGLWMLSLRVGERTYCQAQQFRRKWHW